MAKKPCDTDIKNFDQIKEKNDATVTLKNEITDVEIRPSQCVSFLCSFSSF